MKKSFLAAIGFAACFACTLLAAQAPLPTVLDYVKNPDFKSARISPDGKHIALLVPRADTEALMILDTATKQTKAAFETRRNNGIFRYWWANEERIVFTTSMNLGGSDQVGITGDIFALNVDDTQKYQLGGPSIGELYIYDVLDTMENDREHIKVVRWPVRRNSIARSQPEALLMDIYKPPASGGGGRSSTADRFGETVTSPLPWGGVLTDNTAEVRMAYGMNDEGKLQVKLRIDGEWTDVASFLGATENPGMPYLGQPIGFTADNHGIYHYAQSPQGTIGVALYDIASRTTNLLYAHEKYDVTTSDLIQSADGKSLVGVTIMGAQAEPHYFGDHPDQAFFTSLDKSLAGIRINFLNFTDDQRKGLAIVSSPTVVPGLFILDRDKGSFSPLFSMMPKLQGAPMTKAELISASARDGTVIDGYLTRAAGIDGPAPLIVLVHGGPHNVRDNPVFDPQVKLFASRGYSVLQVNYRGSGGYGIAFQEKGYRNWGTAMVDDVIDLTRHVTDQGLADLTRICAVGASYGAYSAMMAVARYPDMFRCGVGISGVYDLTMMRTGDVPFLPGGEAFIEQILGSDKAELTANSPVTLAANITAPLFLAHGGADRRAVPKHADRLKDALDDADKPYEWFFVRTAGHGLAQPENREQLYTKLLDFFAANL